MISLDLLNWAVLHTSSTTRVFTTVLIQNTVLYKSCKTAGGKRKRENNSAQETFKTEKSLTHKRSKPGPCRRVGTGSPHMQTSSVDMLL